MTLSEYLEKTGMTADEYFDRQKRRRQGITTYGDYQSNLRYELSNTDLSDVYDTLTKGGYLDSNTLNSYKSRVNDYSTKLSRVDNVDEDRRKEILDNLSLVNQSIDSNISHWSKWATEDDYKKSVLAYEYDQNQLNFDVDAGQKELDRLTEILNKIESEANKRGKNAMPAQYQHLAYTDASKYLEGSGYNTVEELRDAVSKKSSNLTLVKRRQEQEQLKNTALNAEDFEIGSQYVSTGVAPSNYNDPIPQEQWSDYIYEHINGNDQLAAVSRISGFESAVKYIDQISEEQKKIFNWYHEQEKKGLLEKGSALKYLSSIEDTLSQKTGAEIAESIKDKTLLQLGYGVVAGFDQFESGMENLFNFSDDYIAPSSVQYASSMIREDLDNPWLQAGYDLVTTTTNMLPSIAFSTIVTTLTGGLGLAPALAGQIGAGVGAVTLGASASGNAYQEMLNLGYDKGQARMYSALTGISEAGLQYALGGISKLSGGLTSKLTSKAIEGIAKGVNKASAQFAIKYGAKFLGNMASEGFEEFLQEILTPYFKSLATGEKPEDIDWEQAVYSGMLGALSAGFLDGVGAIGTTASNIGTAKDIKKEGTWETLKKVGSTFSADSVAYKIADKVTEKTGAFKMAMLLHDVNANLSEQNKQDITNALLKKGVDKKSADSISKWLAVAVDGGKFSKTQQMALEENPIISRVFKQVILDKNSTVNQRAQGLMDIYGTEGQAGIDYASLYKSQTNDALSVKATVDIALKQVAEARAKRELGIGTDRVTKANTDAMFDDMVAEAVKAKEAYPAKTIEEAVGKEIKVSPEKGVSPQRIESIEDEQIMVKTADGAVQDASEVTTKTQQESDLLRGVVYFVQTANSLGIDVDASSANSVMHYYDPNSGVDVNTYIKGATEAVKYGVVGQKKDTIGNGEFYGDLTKAQQDYLYNVGRKIAEKTATKDGLKANLSKNGKVTRPTKKLNKTQEATIQMTEKLSEAGILKNNFHFFYSVPGQVEINGKIVNARVFSEKTGSYEQGEYAPNGYYQHPNGDIYIDLNSGNSGQGLSAYTLAHELGHFVKKNNAQGFKILADFIANELGVDLEKAINKKLDTWKELGRTTLTYMDAYEDVICDALEPMFTDGNLAQKLVKYSKGKKGGRKLLKTLMEFFDQLIARIKRAYKNLPPDDLAAVAMKNRQEALEKASDLFAKALVETTEIASVGEDIKAQKNTTAGGDVETVNFSLRGVNKEGIEVYETSEDVRNLSYKERMALFLSVMENQYKGRTAKFTRNGHTYYAAFENADINKNIYGDKLSDEKGWKAKINVGADGGIFELVENSKYNGSQREKGKKITAHKGVGYWDYFVKTVQIDNTVFDLVANVRKKTNGAYVYSIQLNENKNIKASPSLDTQNSGLNRMLNASNNIIDNPTENVKENFESADIADVVGGNVDLDGDVNEHFSDRTIVEGAGLQFIPDKDGVHYKVLDSNGKAVKSVTPEMMINSPLGNLVTMAKTNGFLGKGKEASIAANKQYEFLAELVNMCINYNGLAPIWETAGTMVFSSIKSNADKQYGLTIDFSTVCKKTQAVVDAMSEAMVRLGRGLTRSEVETIYLEVGKAGESTPCPVCYVFSRWMGIGGILDQMNRFQDKYYNMSEAQLQAFISDVKQRIEERANTPNAKGNLKSEFFDKNGAIKEGQVIADLKQKANSKAGSTLNAITKNADTQLQIQELEVLMKNQEAKEAKKTAKAIEKLKAKLVDVSELESQFKGYNDVVEEYEAYQWLTRTLMKEENGKWVKNKQFKPVPSKVLFDLNKGAEFAENYPLSWAFRTGKGASAGKAITPYADARVGEAIQGIASGDVKSIKTGIDLNPFLNGDTKTRLEILKKAIEKQAKQNLIGGQRYQSTSDFRYEYGSDYLITFLEMQAIGAKVQLYTKVIEAVDFLATMGADVNLSVMPLSNGYVTLPNGKKKLIYSSVTGIDADAAIAKAHEYDNVQLILVGISDEHIRLALEGEDVTFVIPFHGSGNTVHQIQVLMNLLGENLDVTTAQDYTAVQSDHISPNRTKEQKAMWDLRVNIIMGKASNLTEAERNLLNKNAYLKDLYRRFYVDKTADEYGIKLGKDQAEQIFPYEYWDKSLTYAEADRNGDRFKEYCASMGIIPRFSGMNSKGENVGFGDFTNDKGYWKLLIDRKMYDNTYDSNGNWTGYGKYHVQQRINCSNFQVKHLDPEYGSATYGDVMSKANDPKKTNAIVDRAIAQFENVDTISHSDRIIDSEGNQLSKGQQEYFKDSKIRDKNGNLLVVYHGTPNKFTVFVPRTAQGWGTGIYFTDNKSETVEYGDNVVEAYLNITNPFNADTMSYDGIGAENTKAYRDYDMQVWKQRYDEYDTYEEYREDGMGVDMYEIYTEEIEIFNKILRELGYDGIIADHSNNIDGLEIVAFYPDQVKLTSNQNPTTDPDISFSDRDIRLDSRTLLANALESTAQNETERDWLKRYKAEIKSINADLDKLAKINAEIKEISFTKDSDRSKLPALNNNKKTLEDRITRKDKYLLKIEASKPLKRILDQEKAKAKKDADARVREAIKAQKETAAETLRNTMNMYSERIKNQRDGRNKTEMRHKIKKVVGDLKKLLNRGTRERNVKVGLRDTVGRALATAEILFSDEITNADIVRLGVESVTPQEQEYLAEYANLLDLLDEKTINAGENVEIARIRSRISRLNSLLKDVFIREKSRLNRENVSDAMNALAQAYKDLQNSDDAYIKENAFVQGIHDRIINLSKWLEGTTIKDMSLQQLTDVYTMYSMVKHMVTQANTIFRDGRRESLSQMISLVQGEIDSIVSSSKDRVEAVEKIRDYVSSFSWNNLKPYTAFERLGSKTFEKLFWDVIEADNVWAKDIKEAADIIESARKKHGYKKWDTKAVKTFHSSNGLEFKLTLGDMMSIYAYSKRPQAEEHMTIGGFVFDTNNSYKEKKKGITLSYKHAKLSETYRVNAEVIEAVKRELAKYDGATEYVDEIQGYLTKLGEKGNEVSRELFGIDLFKEKVYFPLQSATDYRSSVEQTLNATQTMASLKNTGVSKETVPHASNPIVLRAFDEVVLQHINTMAKYHAYVMPIENLSKVFNNVGKDAINGDYISTQALITSKFGNSATKYFDQFITDLNGGAFGSGAENPLMKLFGVAKATQVAANLSVVVQQYFSVIRALDEINPKYVVPFLNSEASKSDDKQWEELKKYAPIAIIKEIGGIDMGANRSAIDYMGDAENKTNLESVGKKVKEGQMWLAGKMDEIGWGTIWRAVKKEIADTTNLAPGTEEFFKACGKRVTEVIVKTQVYDSVTSRSGYMRSNRDSVKYLTSFMGEATTIVNMMFLKQMKLVRAIKSKDTKAIKEASKQLGRTSIAIMLSTILGSLVKSFIYGLRDDEDDALLERWANSFGESLASDMNPLNMLPGLRDIVSVWEGWDVERPDMTLIADILTSFKKTMEDGETEDVLKLIGSLSNLSGYAVSNVIRDGKAIFRLITDVVDDNDPTDIGGAFSQGFSGDSDKEFLLDRFIKTGDKAIVKNEVSDMIAEKKESGKTDKEAKSAVRQSFISRYREEYIKGNSTERNNIRKLLYATGLWSSLTELDELLAKWRKEATK